MQAVNGTFFKVLFCCPNDRPIGEGARIYYKSCGLLFCLSPAYYIWIGGPKIEKTQDSSPKAKRRYQPSAPFFHWQNRLSGVSVSHRLIDTAPVAFSMGASQTTSNIWKSWCRMLGGQIFLLLMNAWCLRLFTSMVGSFISNPLSL